MIDTFQLGPESKTETIHLTFPKYYIVLSLGCIYSCTYIERVNKCLYGNIILYSPSAVYIVVLI